jgi:hypothetical protein
MLLSFTFRQKSANVNSGSLNGRRGLLKGATALPAMAAHADVPPHLWWGFDFVSGLAVRERLNQGPFDVDTITYDHGELFG